MSWKGHFELLVPPYLVHLRSWSVHKEFKILKPAVQTLQIEHLMFLQLQ